MAAIKIHHTAVDTESSWDGPGEVAKAPNDAKTLHYMHAWQDDNGDPEAKSSYKFPHHKAGTDTAANLAGVNNALSRLPQADIPDGDRAGVKAHLDAHRKDAGLDVSEENLEPGFMIVRKPRTYFPHYLITGAWAILPEKLIVLQEIFDRYMSGEKLDPEAVQAAIHGAKRPANRQIGKVAVLPLFGTIFPRANLMTDVSGATSAEMFGKHFDELMKDPGVSAIILDVDSPGGYAAGIPELADKIYQARSTKPISAISNHMMDSAAYWIGSAAEEVVITPSGEAGSIGVWAAHDDVSKSLEMDGIKRTLVSAGKYKVEGNPWEPLTEEARAQIQTEVNLVYDQFVKAVARNRGVKLADVKSGFGEGRAVDAQEAIKLGMADRIATIEDTVKRMEKIAFVRSDEGKQQAEALRSELDQILCRGGIK